MFLARALPDRGRIEQAQSFLGAQPQLRLLPGRHELDDIPRGDKLNLVTRRDAVLFRDALWNRNLEFAGDLGHDVLTLARIWSLLQAASSSSLTVFFRSPGGGEQAVQVDVSLKCNYYDIYLINQDPVSGREIRNTRPCVISPDELKHLRPWNPTPGGPHPPARDPPWPANTTLPLTYHPVPDIARAAGQWSADAGQYRRARIERSGVTESFTNCKLN